MKDQSLWYLENIDLEGFFCPNKLNESMEGDGHQLKAYKKDEYIYLPEESSDAIYMIVKGEIKIGSFGENGKEISKTMLSKGEVFGELAIVGQEKRRDFAKAMSETQVCSMNANKMKELLKDHNQFSMFFMKILGSRVLEMEQRLESLVFKDSKSRIVEYLLNLVEKKGQRVGYEWVVRNFITHQEIANFTATSRQTVTTILNELRNDDIITFDRKRLLIRDIEKLQEKLKLYEGDV